MKDLVIDRIEIQVVEPDTQRLAWSEEMHGQFMSNTLVRVTTRDGIVGVAGGSSCTGFGFDRAVAESAKLIAPMYLGVSVHDRTLLWHRTRNLNVPFSPIAQAVIDVALWDAAAKAADQPLHALLGAGRNAIASYASTPLYDSAEAYVDEVGRLQEAGFTAVKFHCWCNPARDLPMCERVAAVYGQRVGLMLDVEQRYDRAQAARAARLLAELGFVWFEAPLLDFDLAGYADLRRRHAVDILPAGTWLVDRHQVAQGIEAGAWDRVRIDVMSCGGITPARDIAALAAAHNMPIEFQCWGYTLTQAANLHMMLAAPTATYFEQPIPYEPFEYGSSTVIRTNASGMASPPEGPGLGVLLDWSAIDKATSVRFDIRS
jgi:L-alanine-DL-glutamate epimerase-like enolase superfamily enzyme